MSALLVPVIATKDRPAGGRFPWWLTVCCCAYFVYLCWIILKIIPPFAALHEGLGNIPFPTNVLIATYRWSVPLFFLCASAVAVIRKFVLLEDVTRRLADVTLALAAVLPVPLVVLAMYWPLFVLIHKLQQMH